MNMFWGGMDMRTQGPIKLMISSASFGGFGKCF